MLSRTGQGAGDQERQDRQWYLGVVLSVVRGFLNVFFFGAPSCIRGQGCCRDHGCRRSEAGGGTARRVVLGKAKMCTRGGLG